MGGGIRRVSDAKSAEPTGVRQPRSDLEEAGSVREMEEGRWVDIGEEGIRREGGGRSAEALEVIYYGGGGSGR